MIGILSWLSEISHCTGTFRPVLALASRMDKILRSRGVEGCILWCKSHRLALLHYLSGESHKRVEGVRQARDGFPTRLGIGRLELEDRLSLRLVLTLLYSTRAFSVGRNPDWSTITDPPKSMVDFSLWPHPQDFFREVGYSRRKLSPRSFQFNGKFHMTSKAGPNGHALWTSLWDLFLLIDSPILNSVLILGGPKLGTAISTVLKWKELLPEQLLGVGTTLRKLSWFPDKENKVRIVAQLDYYSQTALRGLHSYLFGILKRFPQDCTFNQGSFKDKVKGWTWYESIDLTAATDRFPIILIAHVLKGILPERYVQAWVDVMVSLPFKSDKGFIRYLTGNPMGAYSSWNSFTIAHHYIIWCAGKHLGLRLRDLPYVILGDDVLIGSKELADEYRRLMASIGVDISTIKSHSSSKLFEFAKRLFLNGEEISPFPISAIPECGSKFYLLTNLLLEESRKGWDWPFGISQAVELFETKVLKRNSTRGAKVEKRSFNVSLMIEFIRGRITVSELLLSVLERHAFPADRPFFAPPEFCSYVVNEMFNRAYISYLAKSDDSEHSLGYLGMSLCISIWSKGQQSYLADNHGRLEYSIPLLNVFGHIVKSICRPTVSLDTDRLSVREVIDLIKGFSIPYTDKVFVEREKNTISRVSLLLSEELVQILNETHLVSHRRGDLGGFDLQEYHRLRFESKLIQQDTYVPTESELLLEALAPQKVGLTPNPVPV